MNSGQKENHNSNLLRIVIVSALMGYIFVLTIRNQITLKRRILDSKEERAKMSISYYDISNDEEDKLFSSYDTIPDDLLNFSIYNPAISYSYWDPDKYINFTKSSDFQKCLGCGTEFQNPSSDSTEKDLILFYVTGLLSFSFKTINSIRSSNCMATIVIFIDQVSAHLISKTEMETLNHCNVFIINIGNIEYRLKSNSDIIYHIFFHEFLKAHRNQFNRVIILNPTKTIIQSDPFTTHFHKNIIGITATLSNKDKLESFDDENQNVILEPTPIYGSVDGVIAFYSIIFHDEKFNTIKTDYYLFDTSIQFKTYVNTFFRQNYFEKFGIKILVALPGNFICSIADDQSLSKVVDSYDSSPNDLTNPGRSYYTSRYYRERFPLYTYAYSKNPPALISFVNPVHGYGQFLFSCPNILIQKHKIRSHKKSKMPMNRHNA